MITLQICNDKTGNPSVANYDVKALTNGRVIGVGKVFNFRRGLGAKALIQTAAETLWTFPQEKTEGLDELAAEVLADMERQAKNGS